MASITTKRGDDGQSDLIGGSRAAKSDRIYDALGDLDELSCALGMVRVTLQSPPTCPWLDTILHQVQLELIQGMGDVAAYMKDQAPKFSEQALVQLEAWQAEHEAKAMESMRVRGWALPGSHGIMAAAQLDFARAVARRAERSVFALLQKEGSGTLGIFPTYLNRLSDSLWVFARLLEA